MKQGIYEQLINTITRQEISALDPDVYNIGTEKLDAEEARKLLSTYLAAVTRRALKIVREQTEDNTAVLAQVRTSNEIIATLKETLGEEEYNELKLDEQGEVLTHVYSKLNNIRAVRDSKIIRPDTPIAQSSLFTGAKSEPSMLLELQKEIVTADRIDWLVSFIKFSGLRLLLEQLQQFTSGGGKLRIITTTYMEATDLKAIVELSKLPNTEIQISYDTKVTRLHAKTYIFHRETGFTTAYVGSSNLSNPALTSGMEWNLKVTEKDSLDVLRKIEATFESYWNDREFTRYVAENERHEAQLKAALNRKKDNLNAFHLDIQPYDYQKEVLEQLHAERTLYGRTRNLIVAATGVGKTVISAFDYKRFLASCAGAKILFVAHREEILKQSRDTFRYILKDMNFGELHVGTHQAQTLEHLFISIQSLNSMKLTEITSPEFYDYIIVDEFHHAAAPSYQKLLSHFEPKILLGLTATPERMDGKDITAYFDHTIAAEIRLTDAIDRKLLSPFQYFGVTDTVDLSQVKWSRKGYDLNELEKLYTHNKIRATQIIHSLNKYVTDLEEVKGLGFCVGVDHALYMAKIFNEAGIPSMALHGGSNEQERHSAKGQLVSGELRMIFVVDLYNEGVDIPEVNTILFLRPTESLTVFLQQLGRGLRMTEGKECLTVLDFIGQAHQEYNFQDKFRALIGTTKHSISHYVENGFSNLPRGTFIQLEKQAKEYIMRNLKQMSRNRRALIQKLQTFQQDTGFRKIIPIRLESWIAYCFLNLLVLLPITIYTLETFFLLVTIGTFFVALYLLIKLHQFINEKMKLDFYLSVPVMLILSLMLLVILSLSYFSFLTNLIEIYSNSSFLIYLTNYITLNFMKTFVVALFSLILVFYVFDALFKIVKSEKLVSESRYQIIFLFVFSLIALVLTDIVFSFLYLSFSETNDSTEFIIRANNNDISKMLFYYTKALYYSFCLHFGVPIPTTGFYSNMQNAVMSYPHLKVLQFLHYTQNKLVELTLFAVIAGHVSNALGLGTTNSKVNINKADENSL